MVINYEMIQQKLNSAFAVVVGNINCDLIALTNKHTHT